jgi:hypothetical protein
VHSLQGVNFSQPPADSDGKFQRFFRRNPAMPQPLGQQHAPDWFPGYEIATAF